MDEIKDLKNMVIFLSDEVERLKEEVSNQSVEISTHRLTIETLLLAINSQYKISTIFDEMMGDIIGDYLPFYQEKFQKFRNAAAGKNDDA